MIIEKLKENQYTETEQNVIDYLLNHLDELEHLSLHALATKTYSSNATIIRLCQKVGYKGYKTFKMDLLKEREANKYLVEDVDYTVPFQFNDVTEDIIQNMYYLYQDSIKKVFGSLDVMTLKEIAYDIIHKKRTFLFCYGDTQTTVMNFANKLVKVNIFPVMATQLGEEVFISTQLGKDDFALFITYRGQDKMHECMSILNKHHVKTGLISAHTSLKPYSDLSIIIPDCEKEHKIATFYSQLAFQYIFSNLYAIIYHEVKD